jgi:hypothetical protein
MDEAGKIMLDDKFKEGDLVYVTSKLGTPVFYIFKGYAWGFHDGYCMQAFNIRSRDVCLVPLEGVKLWPLTRMVLFEKFRPLKSSYHSMLSGV